MGLFLFLSVFSFAPLGFISGPERWFSPAKIVSDRVIETLGTPLLIF